jgi:hypothetical protein
MGCHAARIGDTRNIYRISVAKAGARISLRRPSRKCKDNIKNKEIDCMGADSLHLQHYRNQSLVLVNTVSDLDRICSTVDTHPYGSLTIPCV